MKLVIIRGLPCCGKTIICDKLQKKVSNIKIISIDKYKTELMNQSKDVNFETVLAYSYDKTIEKLNDFYEKGEQIVVIEELFCDKKLFDLIINFINNKKSIVYWFRIERDINKLLLVEKNRTDRKIKNTKEDLINLNKDINNLKVDNEIFIKNENIDEVVNEILNIIKW